MSKEGDDYIILSNERGKLLKSKLATPLRPEELRGMDVSTRQCV